MTHVQGNSAPTKLMETGDIVHLALWSPLLCRTRCGVPFNANPHWIVDHPERVEAPINCMTCLVRADTFEIPLQAEKPATNPDGELVWCKQVFGPPYNHITECCYAEGPCDQHKT